MGRVMGRGRGRDRDRGDLVAWPEGRSRFGHGVRLGLAALVAGAAVALLFPAIVVQELLRRGRRKTLLLAALLAVVAGVTLLQDEDAEPRPAPAVARTLPPAPGPRVAPIALAEPDDVATLNDEKAWLDEAAGARVFVHRSGEPVEGLRVRAWKRGLEGGRPFAVGVTDGAGLAPLGVASAGDLTLLVDLGRGRSAAVTGDEALDLDQVETLSGTVVGPLGEGVSAEVTVWLGALPLATTRADLRGAFELEWVDVPGAVVVATAEGLVPAKASVERGQVPTLRLRRGEVGSLRGRVLDEHGLPLANAIVRALRGEQAALVAATDDLGRFSLPGVEVGAVTLEVHRAAEGVPALRAAARVRAGDPTDVDLRLQQVAGLEVVVRTREGPAPGAVVQLVDPGVTRYGGFSESRAQPRQTADGAGVARFEALPVGRYYVRVAVAGRAAPLLAEVELSAGATGRVVVDERATRDLTVRVVDARGDPVSGVFMDVSMPGINWHGMPASTTGADGVATFRSLPVGLAEVHLGKGDLWRMVRADGDEATFVWSEATSFDLQGWISGYEGEVLVASVLPDVVHMTRARVNTGGLLDATITLPAGPARVFLIAHDRRLAPIELGQVGPGGALRGVRAAFAPGARVTGRLVDARTGRGIPGRVRLAGPVAGVLEAQTQWLGGTDHDEWITVNEWSRATGPDGLFELDGVPTGVTLLQLEALGAVTRSEGLDLQRLRDLGDLPLEPR